jgi:hypothetical protein
MLVAWHRHQQLARIGGQAEEDLLAHVGHTPWRLDQSRSAGILTDAGEEEAHGFFYLVAIHVSAAGASDR